MASENMTKWNVTVSKKSDMSLRTFLAQRGLKKGDLSKFIEDAVNWRVFDLTLTEARDQFADLAPDDLQGLLDEATAAVRPDFVSHVLRKDV